MKSRKALLIKLLQTLVDEWGHEEVSTALASTTVSSSNPLSGAAEGPNPRPTNKKARLSATGQIERAALEGEQREVLLQLAVRYDQKLFLPRVSDVREFLIMMGERPVGMKDRTEAFRILLRSLMQLPIVRLQQLAHTALHSGPSELGPLSDAIAAAGERLPRQRQPTD
jgi:hypothetical protein